MEEETKRGPLADGGGDEGENGDGGEKTTSPTATVTELHGDGSNGDGGERRRGREDPVVHRKRMGVELLQIRNGGFSGRCGRIATPVGPASWMLQADTTSNGEWMAGWMPTGEEEGEAQAVASQAGRRFQSRVPTGEEEGEEECFRWLDGDRRGGRGAGGWRHQMALAPKPWMRRSAGLCGLRTRGTQQWR